MSKSQAMYYDQVGRQVFDEIYDACVEEHWELVASKKAQLKQIKQKLKQLGYEQGISKKK